MASEYTLPLQLATAHTFEPKCTCTRINGSQKRHLKITVLLSTVDKGVGMQIFAICVSELIIKMDSYKVLLTSFHFY